MTNNIVLVTGVAGFIGSKTAQVLLENDYTVVGIDNMNDYYDVRLKEHRLSQLQGKPNFEFIQMDIENYDKLDELFKEKQFSHVINLAARAGVRYSMINPFVYMTTNANATLNLLELMRKYEINKMVLASTSSLYAGQPMPFKETLPVNQPISPYAASKKAAEMMAHAYSYQYGLDISVVRFFTVYGPAGRPDLSIFRFINWIDEGDPIELFGDGRQSREFTYVDDIDNGVLKALKPVGFEIINIGGGNNPISINYCIEFIEKYLDKKAKIEYKPFHKADIKETWADISKAKDLLDWQPTIGLDEGIKRSIDWYLENKSWLQDIEL